MFGLQAAYLKKIDNSLNKKALVIGAGGVSPSVILSLQKSGVKNISIINRTEEKCFFLKRKFNYLNILPWDNLQAEIGQHDIIINATSLGLKDGQDFDVDFSKCKVNATYIDTIYKPLKALIPLSSRNLSVLVFNGL